MQADIQILRVSRGWDVERYAWTRGSAAGGSGPHGVPGAAALRARAAHAERLREIGAARPLVFVLVSLREPARDVAGFLSRAAEQHPREWLAALRGALSTRDRRMLSVAELERAQARAEQARAHLARLSAGARRRVACSCSGSCAAPSAAGWASL